MDWIRNLPLFCIVGSLMCGVLCSVLRAKQARLLTFGWLLAVLVMSACVLVYVVGEGDYFVYLMGHFPAPWGNEIRAGVLEGLMAVFFCLIMLLSLCGGLRMLQMDIDGTKQNLYFVMINLMMSSLLALIYTNDLFTAYVFVEINTIAACALIMIRNSGNAIVAAAKYMIMSLLGSGLILIAISMLYDLTGHLLMSDIHRVVLELAASGEYEVPLTVLIALFSVGLAIKSALFPFHAWLPDAYGHATPASSAILSSLVSKGYIFLLIKLFYRVIGEGVIHQHKTSNILFLFAVAGMIMGSVSAMKEHDIRRLIAFSSIAQIGYIYMGIGLSTREGMIAAVFHILSHGASKSLLFISAAGLIEVSDNKVDFSELKGAGYRNRIAGIGFSVGALSMVGIPLLAGFTSKVYFSNAALSAVPSKMLIALVVLAISTILNASYFIRAIISIYTPMNEQYALPDYRTAGSMRLAIVAFVVLNVILGIFSRPILAMVEQGLILLS